MHDNQLTKEQFILAAVADNREELTELRLLVETSGGETLGEIVQKRENIHPMYYLGQGKLGELKALLQETQADAVICDDELSASQQRNMERVLNARVLDRTTLILDIFAKHAVSAEGKAQVELAQLKYRLNHLTGKGVSLSRLGGGIGTRGPGEKKLESDRRHIRERISNLNPELKDIERQHGLLRENRKRTGMPVISLVGYTNAGKSTLMNALTSAGVLTEDMLFATLDTTTRGLKLPSGGETLIIDTVGFINKLPHQIIQAFHATLDEIRYSDLLLHVVDASNPEFTEQMYVVTETLRKLNCLDKPIINVYNKTDLIEGFYTATEASVAVSAKTGKNIDGLLDCIEQALQSLRRKTALLLPYNAGRFIRMIHEHGEILAEEHLEEGTYILAYLDPEVQGQVLRFAVEPR
jgi:GTP-binding protein HflX